MAGVAINVGKCGVAGTGSLASQLGVRALTESVIGGAALVVTGAVTAAVTTYNCVQNYEIIQKHFD